MRRFLVIGASGSGKSTLAQRIALRLALPYVPTDGFYWEPGWKVASSQRVETLLEAALAQYAWVLDGNFDDQRDWVWPRADCVVWLDYPLPIVLGRVIERNVRWVLTGETVWSGNRMTWRRALSGIRHAARSHGLKRRLYPGYLAALVGPTVLRQRSATETEAWLNALQRPSAPQHAD